MQLLSPNLSGSDYQPVPRRKRPRKPRKQIRADLEDLALALDQKMFDHAQLFVHGARHGFFGANEWMLYWSERLGSSRLRIDRVKIESLQDDEATVEVFYLFSPVRPYGCGDPAHREALLLKRRQVHTPTAPGHELWGIVVDQAADAMALSPFSLRKAAFFLQQAPNVVAYIRADQSQLRLEMLGLAALMFASDFDNRYALAPDYVREALSPYIGWRGHNTSPFEVPGLPEHYAFNARLCEQPASAIAKPERTVLFYEGRDEQPVARYNNQAAICFADGHVKLVSQNEIKTLKWQP